MTHGGVLCVGRLYADLVFAGVPGLPALGTETFARGLSIHAGGGAAITAAYLAALGRPAHLAAYLPGDPFDACVLEELAARGIDIESVVSEAGREEPQVTVAIATGGDRAFLTRAAGRACPPLDFEAIGALGVGHLHLGELRTLVEMPDLAARAKAAGMSVSLDCGWDPDLGPEVAALIAGVDVFLPNAGEVALLADLGLPERPAPLTVVKRGAEGATVLSHGAPLHRAAHPVAVVETTGAGDAFNGGFLHEWLSGNPLPDCLDGGLACGARAVGAPGGMAGAMAIGPTRTRRTAAR